MHQALGQALCEHYLIYSPPEPYKVGIINPILQMKNTEFMKLNNFPNVSDAINSEVSITKRVCLTPGLVTVIPMPSPILVSTQTQC